MGLLDRFFGSPRDRFAAEALRIARRAPGIVRAAYDAEKFAVAAWRDGSGSPVWIYLANVFAETQDARPADRAARLTQLVRIILTPHDDESWDEVRTRLRPVLRPDTFGQAGPMGMVPPLSRAALPHLRELVVVDRPESMAYVTPPRLEEWGVSADDVFAAARQNLAELAEQSLRQHWPDGNAMVRMVDSGDGYFTSLLLAPGWLAGVSERMGEPVVAFVPDVNTVLLCPADGGAATALHTIVESEFSEAARSISLVGYIAGDGGRVVPYAPPPGHPAHPAAQRARVLLTVTQYRSQTEWLSAQYAEHGIDVYVGGLLAAAGADEPPFTVASWGDGIESLLPEADFIAFAGPDGVWGRVPWDAVARLVPLAPEPLLTPARYRVGGWPAPDVMQQLRAYAVD